MQAHGQDWRAFWQLRIAQRGYTVPHDCPSSHPLDRQWPVPVRARVARREATAVHIVEVAGRSAGSSRYPNRKGVKLNGTAVCAGSSTHWLSWLLPRAETRESGPRSTRQASQGKSNRSTVDAYEICIDVASPSGRHGSRVSVWTVLCPLCTDTSLECAVSTVVTGHVTCAVCATAVYGICAYTVIQ